MFFMSSLENQIGNNSFYSSKGDIECLTELRPCLGEYSPEEELLVLEPKVKTKRPPFYKVVMINDDYTPMDFVVNILTKVFHHTEEDALNITLQIHNKGAGTCGVFTYDVAETKADIVIASAKSNEYPLQCVVEKE